MKTIIVGGVAGGASCAARLRRLDEHRQIVMIERGPYISYASCGLPYHVGGVIERESSLLVSNAERFRSRFNVDVRTGCEAVTIAPKERTITLRDTTSGTTIVESYDHLVLSPGAAPIRPPLPGIDLPGIFQVRTVPDAREIRAWIDRGQTPRGASSQAARASDASETRRAVVVGGGFIGLEMAENLVHRGFEVTIIELADQVLLPLDGEMARLVETVLERHGVRLVLGDGVAAFRQRSTGGLEVTTSYGAVHPAELVILALGVRPDVGLARAAGLAIGERGGILVDDQMRTSDPHILAVGDAVEVKDFLTGERTLMALAGPANRQGRIAADVICGRASRFRGTQGTAIIGLFGATAAWTGVNEKTLRRLGDDDHEHVDLSPNSHAGYYPGATPIAMKVIFRTSDGRLLGAQAVGEDGVDKRISTLAAMIQLGATVEDLEEAELCYAPQFGSAKDPVNFAGMIAANVRRGDMPLSHWESLDSATLLDVREPREVAEAPVPDAVHIPLDQLRQRLGELPRDRGIHVFCRSGQRAYLATRILLQHGLRAFCISGGTQSLERLALHGREAGCASPAQGAPR